jgi:hypothetical protein
MNEVSAWDKRQGERFVILGVVIALVLLRAVVPTIHEGYYFDSDQAIIGLMAKRLSTFQGFPLFYDGLNYILGVESWIIAPFFWIAGPTVAVMRVPLTALNIVVAIWLLTALGRRLGVRPIVAFAGALPFAIPAPAVAGQLLETAGACVEPFVYVLLLWRLRQRPLAFGAVLAVGFLHREFTIFSVPALIVVEAASGAVLDRANLRRLAWIAAGFGLVWLAVDAVKLYQAGLSLGLQASSLAGQMCMAPAELGGRAATVFTQALPVLYGGTLTQLLHFRMNTALASGSAVIGWMIAVALGGMCVRVAWMWSRRPRFDAADAFFVYLALIGVFTVAAYPLSCNIIPGQPPLLRYLLLGLLLPVGCFGAFMRRETSRALRTIVPVVFALWGTANLVDNVRLIRVTAEDPPSNEHRVIADYLVRHQIQYARAIYWDAYAIDFLARERVIVSSVDVVRIPAYKQLVDDHNSSAYNLPRVPCTGGPQVASWCVQPP